MESAHDKKKSGHTSVKNFEEEYYIRNPAEWSGYKSIEKAKKDIKIRWEGWQEIYQGQG